jgi:hypothetical protein
MNRESLIKIYDEIVSECDFERKGKTMPYTSSNGHMFSQVNKDGELGIRFSKETQKRYLEEFNTKLFMSYNSVMKGYITIPTDLLSNKELLKNYLLKVMCM